MGKFYLSELLFIKNEINYSRSIAIPFPFYFLWKKPPNILWIVGKPQT